MTSRDIRRRTIALFLFGIVVPSALLAYLAFRGIRNDQALLERERREDLQRVLDDLSSAHDSSLLALADAFASALTESTEAAEDPARAASRLVTREPWVEAAFRVSPEGGIDRLLAPHLLYRTAADPFPQSPSSEDGALQRARRREFDGADPSDVLQRYLDVATSRSEPGVRADALNSVARLHRRMGDRQAALAVYRRLGSDFGTLRTAGGIPFRLVVELEAGSTQLEAGDVVAAVRTWLGLYALLLRGETDLSEGQFAFLEQQTRERADGAISAASRSDGSAPRMDSVALADSPALFTSFADSLATLTAASGAALARTERLLAFERVAGPMLSARLWDDSPLPRSSERLALDLEGRRFYVQPAPGPRDSGGGAWGLVLDEAALVQSIETTIAARTAGTGVGWALSDPSGASVRERNVPGDPTAAVSATLPGGIPRLTIHLYPADAGFVRTLVTSRRGIFFFAFLLIAGILVVALVLTLNTVSQQLELSRMQSDFVSTVSHELRSPLTAIRQIAEMLQADKVPSEAKRHRYHDVLVEQSERLSAFVDRVLDFSRMESGTYALAKERVDLNVLLDELVTETAHRVDHAGFVVRPEIEDGLPHVEADPDALKQAVLNLIDNAVKYSGDSRKLIVRGYAENGHVTLAVEDFGKGMDRAEQARVFERFYRGGDPHTRSVKGTGLGLAVVKHIVEGHGGSVEIESAPERGSTFMLRLPVRDGVA